MTTTPFEAQQVPGAVESLDDLTVWMPTIEPHEQWTDSNIGRDPERLIFATSAGPRGSNLLSSPAVVAHRFRWAPGFRPDDPAEDYLALTTDAHAYRLLRNMVEPVPVEVCNRKVWVSTWSLYSMAIPMPSLDGEPGVATINLDAKEFTREEAASLFGRYLVESRRPDGTAFVDCGIEQVVAALDASGGIGNDDFDAVLDFQRSIQEQLELGELAEPSPPPQEVVDDLAVRAVAIEIDLPIYEEDYTEEAVPRDLPFLDRSDADFHRWIVEVDLATGRIRDWPNGYPFALWLKVTEQGSYRLLDRDGNVIEAVENFYVPHGVVPGEWGDYVGLDIDDAGTITNWPTELSFDEFANSN